MDIKKIFLIAFVASIGLFAVSCSKKQIDKTKYEFVSFSEVGFGTIYGYTEPNANEVKLFAAKAKYKYLNDVIMEAVGGKKGQLAFSDPNNDALSFLSAKGVKADLEDGQIVTIYFRLTRKDGRIDKAEIDLIE